MKIAGDGSEHRGGVKIDRALQSLRVVRLPNLRAP
jgi:hypothetical protein